jgi:hypothetical protein
MTPTLLERVALGLVAAMPLAPTLAADWVRVPASGTDLHYYDRSKVSMRGDEVTYWRKVIFSRIVPTRSGPAKQAIYQEQIHCRDHTLRSLAWQLFAEEGAMLESSANPTAEVGSIVPETIGDRFHPVICGLLAAQRQRDAEVERDEALLAAKRKELEALKAEIERLDAQILRMRTGDTTGAPKTVPPATPEPQ